MKGIQRNTITLNSAISACGKGGQWIWALRLLSAMPTERLQRDTISASKEPGGARSWWAGGRGCGINVFFGETWDLGPSPVRKKLGIGSEVLGRVAN